MYKINIVKTKLKKLTETQRDEFFQDGGLCVEGLIDDKWISKLNNAISQFNDEAKKLTKSNTTYDLQPDHTKENPKLRRVTSPCDFNDDLWTILTKGPVGDVAEDLLGETVRFYQSKLNFKSSKGGTEVKWHQDKPFFPHTNDSVITLGVYLKDCDDPQGPLEIINGSHRKNTFTHYDKDNIWRGNIQESDFKKIDFNNKKVLKGKAGSMAIINYRTVHGSKPNFSNFDRPLLLYVLSSGDSVPYTPQPLKSKYEQIIVRGEYNNRIRCDSGEYVIPPNWSNGYSSIFALQQKENRS